ncbi:MAG: hypothetical protein BECKG1743D_GA0114223_103175 [Candidatus Kentron sp. G]|nr:MAG: hypothetical protein BECKG1743E_GA0114224_103175 [Candidatus Kentron sp. G]VFN01876.1 MAG: hypothetical protein BECKG1743D_GA0114223_103175 [Candidatus Kentron sp. G]VFN05432.1 MAG: hypothetical protein BECKG1743F_GA0114225_110753 [Candidatus Kentron sp. G]
MRHGALLLGESTENFLKVLVFYEKEGVLESIETWQALRTIRNLVAHSYETDYALIAEHFNTLHGMVTGLYQTAGLFIDHCNNRLGIAPANADFEQEFRKITKVDPGETAPNIESP